MEANLKRKFGKQKIKILITDDYSTSRDVGLCLHQALGKNIQLYFLSEKRFPIIRLSRFAKDVFVISNTKNIDLYCDELLDVIKSKNIDVLFPISGRSIERVLRIASKLSKHCFIAPLPNIDSFHTANEKWKLYNFLKSHDIAAPISHCLIPDFDFYSLSYPVLLKPFIGSGGNGIVKLDNPPESVNALKSSPDKDYIVQEYVEGYDIDCSVICKNGTVIAFTIQRPMETSMSFAPKRCALSFISQKEVIEMVKKTMALLKWNGVAHVDLRYDLKKQRFCIIEINPRFWTSILASQSVGVNFPYLLLELTYGINPVQSGLATGNYFSFKTYLRELFRNSDYNHIRSSDLKYHLMDPLLTVAKIVKQIKRLIAN